MGGPQKQNGIAQNSSQNESSSALLTTRSRHEYIYDEWASFFHHLLKTTQEWQNCTVRTSPFVHGSARRGARLKKSKFSFQLARSVLPCRKDKIIFLTKCSGGRGRACACACGYGGQMVGEVLTRTKLPKKRVRFFNFDIVQQSYFDGTACTRVNNKHTSFQIMVCL